MPPMYTFRTAVLSLLKEKWVNLLCTLTIGTGLFLIAATALLGYNLELATDRLPKRFTITVFLSQKLSEAERQAALKKVEVADGVEGVTYISPEDALEELKTLMQDAEYILEGLEQNPLPPTIELAIEKEFVSGEGVDALAGKIGKIEGVEEVYYGKRFLAGIQLVRKGARTVALLMISALTLGILFVCYSTIKILFYRRNEEIETLKLLGATRSFIRAPFLIEGGLIGLLGGALAGGALFGFRYLLYNRLVEAVPMLRSVLVPMEGIVLIPFIGLAIGLVGAYLAIGRIRFS